MGRHRIRTCDLGDCFGNKNYRCKILDESIYKDCPFYKIGKEDMERYADIKSYRYAVDRIATLTARAEQKKNEYRQARAEWCDAANELLEANRWKKAMKKRIKKRLGLIKT